MLLYYNYHHHHHCHLGPNGPSDRVVHCRTFLFRNTLPFRKTHSNGAQEQDAGYESQGGSPEALCYESQEACGYERQGGSS